MSPKEGKQGHRSHLRAAVARLWPSRRSKAATDGTSTSTSRTSTSSNYASLNSFRHFSKLPLELRNQIWQHALPDLGPSLCLYSKRYWQRRPLSVTDDEYIENVEDDTDHFWLHEFRNDLIPPSPLDVPMAFVNREAYRIARRWIRSNGIRYDSYESSFVLPFDPHRDAIFIPADRFKDFVDSSNHLSQDGGSSIVRCRVERIAVTEETLRIHWENIPTGRFFYNSLQSPLDTLLVVLDAPQALSRMKNSAHRWEARSVNDTFIWDDYEKALVSMNGGCHGRREQFARVEELINRFHFYGVSPPPYFTEVRPVLAFRG
ncbi:hypothetical protein K461DRAFT_280341 [Myriangium duriaei CBS 260.36]|uniref:2EXR domain-containing protein n=1 Tax=Myriangium duriaei CBS 260.36 TaxID=1168546 RepID=A0A9P4MK04_9PEZI|nr:hypothetical protein K461DRAFT_280341 [Myriangium duriaei CBS 260.36]